MGGVVSLIGMNYLFFDREVSASDNSLIHQTSGAAEQTDNQGSDVFEKGEDQFGLSATQAGGVIKPSNDSNEDMIKRIYQALSPAVVNITTTQYAIDIWSMNLIPQKGAGSGVIVDKNGYILTNYHVIEPALSSNPRGKAGEIFVTLSNGEGGEASVVGYDEISDLAVIKLKNDAIGTLPVAPLGDSDDLQVGAFAMAIGNPFGLTSTCTAGIISSLNRTIPVRNNEEMEGLIQTDATINPGNSGGPLINSKGQVVGITSVILSKSGGSDGIGFAIPINHAQNVMDDLIKYGIVQRPYMGIGTFPVGATLAKYADLSVTEGLIVQYVLPGSPGEKAGLKAGTKAVAFRQYRIYIDGDIITSLNGEKMNNPLEFQKRIRKMKIGDKAVLEIVRNGKQMRIEVTLEAKPLQYKEAE